jgi:hypothetical protein
MGATDPRGNYMAAVARLAASVPPGTALHVTVRHDEWCALLAGTGPCNCSPELHVEPEDAA